VPRVLEALQGKIERESRVRRTLESFRADFAEAANEKVLRRNVAIPENSSTLWMEVLGRDFRWRGAQSDAELFWNASGSPQFRAME